MFRRGDEPIPGYCLEKSLGRGNYGEVWRASAGGKQVALKFIDISQRHGLKELRGLQRVKDIDHNYLMPITGLWLLDDTGRILPFEVVSMVELCSSTRARRPHRTMVAAPRPTLLIVAMLLGQRSLMDRLREVNSGLQEHEFTCGIPHAELLNYMQQTAEGIDFLNSPEHDLGEGQVAIQHGDIKPDNIMLRTSGTVAICDFGLASILGDQAKATATAAGMVGTTAYMSPEAIKEKPGPASDQYSFAITYYELRTGRLPFEHLSPSEVLLAHRSGNLRLTDLRYEQERAIIRQATSLAPDERFPTCSAMVAALCEAARVTGSADVAPPRAPYTARSSDGAQLAPTTRDTTSPNARDTVCTPRKNEPFRLSAAWSRIALGGLALLLVLALCFAGWRLRPTLIPQPLTMQFRPADVEVSINGESYDVDRQGRVHLRRPADGKFELQVVPHSIGHMSLHRSLTASEFQDGELTVHLDEAPQVALRFEPADVSVFVEGRRLHVDPKGVAQLALRPDGAMDLEVIPKDTRLEAFDARVDYSELEQNQFTLRLRRSSESFVADAREAIDRDDMTAGVAAFAELVARDGKESTRCQEQIARFLIQKAEQYNVGGALQEADDSLSQMLNVLPDNLIDLRIEAKLALAHVRAQNRDWQTVGQLLEEPQGYCPHATDLDDRLRARFWALATFHRTVLAREDFLQLPVLEGLAQMTLVESLLSDWAAPVAKRLKATVLEKALARFHTLSEEQRGKLEDIFGENLPLQSGLLTVRELAKSRQFAEARQLLAQLRDGADVTPNLQACTSLVDLQDPSQELATVVDDIHQWLTQISGSPDKPPTIGLAELMHDVCFCLVHRMQRDCNRLAEPDTLTACHIVLTQLRPYVAAAEVPSLDRQLLVLNVLLSPGDDADGDEQRLRRCADLRAQFAKSPLLEACWAECVLQSFDGAVEKNRAALEKIDLADRSHGDDASIAHFAPYIHYVQGLVAHYVPRETDTDSAARKMVLAFQGASDPPALEQQRRKRRAAEVLLATVRRRRTGHQDDIGTPAFSKEDADKALEYLELIEKLGVPKSDDFQALLAQALYHASNPDGARAHALSEELVAADSPAVTARILLIHARAHPRLSTPQGTNAALASFAAALQCWSQHDFDNGATVYRDVVIPALGVVRHVEQPNEAQTICLAKIYSCRGVLVLQNTDVQIQIANQDHHPFEIAYEAFQKAAEIEPHDPLHLIHQGRALVGIERYNREACLPKLRDLAAAAVRLDPQRPGAISFQGYVQLLAASGESNVDARRAMLRQAEESYTAAIDQSSDAERHLAECYEGRSTVRVKIAILERDMPTKRKSLAAAVSDASHATTLPRRAREETAYHAWGTALQQKAILLDEYACFDQAIQCFEKALELTRGSRRSWAATALNLGRCHFLCVKYGHIPTGSSPSEQLRFAEQYLTEAASVWNDMPPTRAVRSNQAQIHTFASAVFLFRAEEQRDETLYDKADDECAAAARLAWDARDSIWSQYQTNWAELAWRLGSSDMLTDSAQRDTKRQQALDRFEQLLQRASEYVALRDFASLGPAVALANCGMPAEIDPVTSMTLWQTLATEQLRFHPSRPGLPVPLALRQNALEKLYMAATDVSGRNQLVDSYLHLFPPDRGTAGQLRTEWLVRRSSEIVRWWNLQNTWNQLEDVARSDAQAVVELAQRLGDARRGRSLQIDGLTVIGMIDCRLLDDIKRDTHDRVKAGNDAERSLRQAIQLCGDNIQQSVVARSFRARALQGLLVLSSSSQQKEAYAEDIVETLGDIDKEHVSPANWKTIQQLRFSAQQHRN